MRFLEVEMFDLSTQCAIMSICGQVLYFVSERGLNEKEDVGGGNNNYSSHYCGIGGVVCNVCSFWKRSGISFFENSGNRRGSNAVNANSGKFAHGKC